jgi:pilus assembly protein CpaC
LVCLAGLLVVGRGAAAVEERAVVLQVGEQRSMTREPRIAKAAIGDPAIADVRAVSGRELVVVGKRAGSTTLILWSGERQERREVFEVRVQAVSDALGEAVRAVGGAALSVRDNGKSLELSGSVESVAEHDAATHVLRSHDKLALDRTTLGFPHQVQIAIKVVEVDRSVLRELGFNALRNTAGGALSVTPPSSLGGIAGQGLNVKEAFEGFVFQSASGFLPYADAYNLIAADAEHGLVGIISLLESTGYAHTLAEPTLVVASGQSASFLAGGEFPVPVSQGGGNGGAVTIEYREFGVRLVLHPTVVSAQRIVLKVAPEVSELDFSAGVTAGGVSVPALNTRRADTTVELGDGESFVIGGLIRENMTAAAGQIPWLGDVPVLGALFRSSRFQRDESELLMVVSPQLVRPIGAGSELPPLPGAEGQRFTPSAWDLVRGRVTPEDDGGFAP